MNDRYVHKHRDERERIIIIYLMLSLYRQQYKLTVRYGKKKKKQKKLVNDTNDTMFTISINDTIRKHGIFNHFEFTF